MIVSTRLILNLVLAIILIINFLIKMKNLDVVAGNHLTGWKKTNRCRSADFDELGRVFGRLWRKKVQTNHRLECLPDKIKIQFL